MENPHHLQRFGKRAGGTAGDPFEPFGDFGQAEPERLGAVRFGQRQNRVEPGQRRVEEFDPRRVAGRGGGAPAQNRFAADGVESQRERARVIDRQVKDQSQFVEIRALPQLFHFRICIARREIPDPAGQDDPLFRQNPRPPRLFGEHGAETARGAGAARAAGVGPERLRPVDLNAFRIVFQLAGLREKRSQTPVHFRISFSSVSIVPPFVSGISFQAKKNWSMVMHPKKPNA